MPEEPAKLTEPAGAKPQSEDRRLEARSTRRMVVAVAILIALPLYIMCGFMHVCMAGHMQHAPYPVWHYMIDGTWIFCFVLSAVLSWKSNLRLRRTIFMMVTILFLSRLVLGSGGGTLFLIELPLVIALAFIAARNLFSGAPDRTQDSEELRRSRRRKIVRGWALAGAILVGGSFIVWAGIQCYWFFKAKMAQQVTFVTLPASQEIFLSPGDACTIQLPNNKTVALWRGSQSGFAAVFGGADLNYGEVPFRQLESEEIHLPDGGMTHGEYRSYIRQGPVLQGNGTWDYILYVDQWSKPHLLPDLRI
jgi:hypothetical protein